MAEAKREERTISHALFTYTNEAGIEHGGMAFRGQTVALLPADIKRGEAAGAFTNKVGDEPQPSGSTLPPFPVDGESVEEEQVRWVESGTVDEVLAAVNADPSIAEKVSAAEQRRHGGAARVTLLEALTKVQQPSA